MKFSNKVIFILLLTTILMSCVPNGKNNQQKTEILSKAEYQKQIRQIENLKKSMAEYMNLANTSYTEKDIEQCEKILFEYIQNIENK